MNDKQFFQIKCLLENIDKSLKEQNKDPFFLNFYDGVIIGTVSGIISGLILFAFEHFLT